MSASASWTFDVVDVNGSPLTDAGLVDFDNLELAFTDAGTPDVFSCQVPLDSQTAYAITAPDISNDRDVYIKAYRSPTGRDTDRVLRFYGPVWFDQVLGSQRSLALVAASPDVILAQRYTNAQYTAQDLGTLIKNMVDTTNSTDGETGLLTSTSFITASSTIDVDLRTNLPTIRAMIQQFQTQLDGVDCWTMPIELAAGKIAQLWMAPRRGSASSVVFAYGEETEANCADMTRSRDTAKIQNDSRGYSDTLTSTKTDPASIAAIRRLVGYTSYTGETSQTVLDARTQGTLDISSTRAKVAEYTVELNTESPRLFDDYNIGDTVGLYFRDGLTTWDVSRRVRMSKIQVDANGNEIPAGIEFRVDI